MNLRNLTIAFAVTFVVLSLVVKVFGEDFSANSQLFHLINGAQSSLLDSLMVGLSKYGREYFWIPVLILLWVLGRETHPRTALLMTMAFILAILLGEVSKIVINAPRPELVLQSARILIPGETDPSFPSGHSLIVSTGAILSLLRLSKRIALPLTLEALLVSYSRVYIGVHWPVDLLGGWLLGGFCATLILFQENRFEPAYQFLDKRWKRLRRN